MKLKNLIIFLLLFSCGLKTDEMKNENIISKNEFTKILIDIQLAEANFELNKVNNATRALDDLKEEYSKIYKDYNIDENIFTETLSYYSERPAELEEIYLEMLEELNFKREQLP